MECTFALTEAHTPAKVIVVVEDNEATAELIAECLDEEPGYRVLTAGSAGAALEVIRCQRPDLILLDIKLPDIDGFELYDILQADTTARDIPILFITASASSAIKADLERRRIAGYIAKPFEIDYLLSRVREVVWGGKP
jgi:CheY-like chemotaxis protein